MIPFRHVFLDVEEHRATNDFKHLLWLIAYILGARKWFNNTFQAVQEIFCTSKAGLETVSSVLREWWITLFGVEGLCGPFNSCKHIPMIVFWRLPPFAKSPVRQRALLPPAGRSQLHKCRHEGLGQIRRASFSSLSYLVCLSCSPVGRRSPCLYFKMVGLTPNGVLYTGPQHLPLNHMTCLVHHSDFCQITFWGWKGFLQGF